MRSGLVYTPDASEQAKPEEFSDIGTLVRIHNPFVTGELSLTGHVLPVGGIREKSLPPDAWALKYHYCV